MRPLFFAVGGTAGHLFPALALKRRLNREVWLIGKGLKTNPYVADELNVIDISSATFSKRSPLALFKLGIGFFQSLFHLVRLRPCAVIGFGSYHSLPLCFAAWALRIPLHLYEYNVKVGRANRWLSRFAKSTSVVFEESARELKSRVHVVAPLLHHQEKVSKEEAASYFGLDPNKKTLLIFGGSQGAVFMNRLACHLLKDPSFEKSWQAIHLTGVGKEISHSRSGSLCSKAFEPRMDFAWSLADLALCRAGAGAICEALKFGVPLVAVPYPYARGHQQPNGLLIEKRGLGICMDESMGEEKIAEKTLALMKNKSLLASMGSKNQEKGAPLFEELVKL